MRRRKTATDRRAEITDATLALAFEVGPDLVTTGMIAARLHLTQPAIYKHFPRKDDIWNAVAARLAARITANIENAANSGPDPVARLRSMVMGHLQLVQAYPALPDIMIARDPQANLQSGRSHLQQTMGGFRRILVSTVEAAIKQREFRADLSPADAAALIIGVVQSLVLQMLVSRNPANLLADGERLFNLLLCGFQATGERR